MNTEELEKKARLLRQLIFKTICNGGGGHLPTSLSMIDVLTVLYYNVLNIDPKKPKAPDRDRFVLSKGHGGVALYAVLADKGFFDKDILNTYGKCGTILGGHPDMHKVPGIEASTGALGHGFPFAVGIALAGKDDNKDYRVYVMIGDGECQEGSIWEAALFAPKHCLDNLTVIIDNNKLQAMDSVESIVPVESLAEKWKAFGWAVKEIDGHDFKAIVDAFDFVKKIKGKPTVIIANTIKGKGISFMENIPIWHYRLPNIEQMKIAVKELGLEIKDNIIY